ncbi:MAG TPA: PAS domain-containing protein, partial [Roseiflexaceae bacterium]|nr:PAS domain-containing protein [Roseiflexaceae bacterium]
MHLPSSEPDATPATAAARSPDAQQAVAANDRLQRTNRLLLALAQIVEPDAILPTACRELATLLPVSGLLVATIHGAESIAERHSFGEPLAPPAAEALEQLGLRCISSGSALMARTLSPLPVSTGITALAALPLRTGEHLAGALLLASRNEYWPAEQWELLLALADAIATAMSRAERQREGRRQRAHAEAVLALTSATLLLVDRTTHRVIDANPSAEALTGYPHSELLQRTRDQLIGPAEPVLPQADALAEREAIVYRRDATPIPVLIAESSFNAQGLDIDLLTIREFGPYQQRITHRMK